MMILLTSQSRYVVVAFVVLFLFISFAYFTPESAYPAKLSEARKTLTSWSGGQKENPLQQALQFIYNHDRFNLSTPSFEYDGTEYKLPETLAFTSSLGKDLCILDVDTRPLDNKGQIFHDGNFEWSKQGPYSGGIMNHYMYAQTHGYDYKFYRANKTDDRHATWVKVAALTNVLKQYKYVVFLDADAIFNQMHIPLEWMMNYWNINSTTSLAMALDPPGEQNEDIHGRLNTNTGFIIAQNNTKTFEILKAWDECTTEERYKGCAKWNKVRFHEQSAYSSYIRYDYDEYLKEIPCNEANGEWDYDACHGVFIQHMWFRTQTVRSHFGDKTLQALMGRMHEDFMGRKEELVESG